MGSVVVDVCLVLGLKNSRRDTGLIAALGARWERISNSHFRDAYILESHTPLSYFIAFLFPANPGISEGVFRYEKLPLKLQFLLEPILGGPSQLGRCAV